MLKAIIVSVPRHVQHVKRLVDHCRHLDGTELQVVEVTEAQDRAFQCLFPNNRFPCLQSNSFRLAAQTSRDAPFCYMEVDSIPICAGWLKTLESEYESRGKPFLYSSDSNPPGDVVGGIGVYPKDSHWLLPVQYPIHAFDMYVHRHFSEITARTPLIQHSYGFYKGMMVTREHRFPRDRAMLRPEAVIFHRDKHQDLIIKGRGGSNGNGITRWYHTGDLGDIISALPIIRKGGGGELIIGNHLIKNPSWRKMEGERFNIIAPLLENQCGLSSVRFEHGAEADYDFQNFRQVYDGKKSLTWSHAKWIGIDPDLSPWLKVNPSSRSSGKIVVNRTLRYHNPRFPWKRFLSLHRKDILFVGLPDEHRSISMIAGFQVPYVATPNLLAVAELISGSRLFVGNQSVACWIAMALGHNLIQETWNVHPDSIIPRPNAHFVSGLDYSAFTKMGAPVR